TRCAGCRVAAPLSGPSAATSTMAGIARPIRRWQYRFGRVNSIAERYVRLVLQVGRHDADYVDAYYGDARWRPSGPPVPLAELSAEVRALRHELTLIRIPEGADELLQLRHDYLDRQLAAVDTRLAMLQGVRYDFDEESRRLYDTEAPPHS